MNALVAHLGFSRSRVFEMLKAETGLTPNDFLMRLRVEQAEQLLAKTDQPILDVALDCGFSSSQYFAKVFLKYGGESPSAFRTRARKETGPSTARERTWRPAVSATSDRPDL